MELRKLKGVIGLMAAGILLAAGCGGTLEGKYRRGQIPSSTTTTKPTGGNAAGQRAQGESKGHEPRGTIMGSAAWRNVVPPLGGRHR